MWVRTVDIQSLISQDTSCNGLRDTLVKIASKLRLELTDRLHQKPYDTALQDLLDDFESLAVLLRMQPKDKHDQAFVDEANEILLKLYAYANNNLIWLGEPP